MVARHHPPLPHPEQHAHGIIAVAGVADDVGVAGADHLDPRRLVHPFQPPQRVTELGRALVVLALAGLCHRLAHPLPDVLCAALEEGEYVVHHTPVVVLALPPDARRTAPADVVVEAGTLPPLPREIVGAAAHGVEPADDGERFPELRDVGVRPEVPGAGEIAPAGDEHAGERLRDGHRDGGVALVVLEPHVESRPVLLDQIVLEQERLGLAPHHDRVHVGDQPLQQLVFRAERKVVGEVAPHPRFQPLRFADVQHLSLSVLPEVDTGAVRQSLELAGECVACGGRHLDRKNTRVLARAWANESSQGGAEGAENGNSSCGLAAEHLGAWTWNHVNGGSPRPPRLPVTVLLTSGKPQRRRARSTPSAAATAKYTSP